MRTAQEPAKALRQIVFLHHNKTKCVFFLSSLQCEKSQKVDLTSQTISDRSAVHHRGLSVHPPFKQQGYVQAVVLMC